MSLTKIMLCMWPLVEIIKTYILWFISFYYFYQKKSTIITEMPFNFCTSHNLQCCGLWTINHILNMHAHIFRLQALGIGDMTLYLLRWIRPGNVTLPGLYLIMWCRSVSHKICQILCRSPSSCQNSSDPLEPSGCDLWCLELGHLPAVLWIVGWKAGSLTWVQQPSAFSKIFQ